jgi:DNA-binding IclR family transcriptional regulator
MPGATLRVPPDIELQRTGLTAGVRVMELMAFGPVSAPQAGSYLRCHPRTARRILHRLAADGWVYRAGSRPVRYGLTLRIVVMAAQALQGAELRQASIPLLERAAAATGLPAYLVIPCYRDVLCLASSSDSPVRQGDLQPATHTAAGRLLLAHREPWRESVLGRVADDERARADAALERIRTDGYAVAGEEMAAPVTWREDGVISALVLIGVQRSEAASMLAHVLPVIDRFA